MTVPACPDLLWCLAAVLVFLRRAEAETLQVLRTAAVTTSQQKTLWKYQQSLQSLSLLGLNSVYSLKSDGKTFTFYIHTNLFVPVEPNPIKQSVRLSSATSWPNSWSPDAFNVAADVKGFLSVQNICWRVFCTCMSVCEGLRRSKVIEVNFSDDFQKKKKTSVFF